MRSPYLLSLVTAVLLATLASSQALAQDYALGEGDLLNITVYDNEDLNTVARVSAGGAISFPLVGEISVEGLTVRQTEEKITSLLLKGHYLLDPHVSVFIQEYRSNKVTILGEVAKPGLYELSGNVTLIEMISRAGGLTGDAGGTLVVQHKGRTGKEPDCTKDSCVSVDLKALMEEGDLTNNLQLQDGDSIYIGRSGVVYVTGEVNKPGAYKIEKDTDVIKAVTLAGGFTGIASPGRTSIIRKKDGDEVEIDAEMNTPVKPDDVISVPESFF